MFRYRKTEFFNNREHYAKRDANIVLVNNQLVINLQKQIDELKNGKE